LSTYTRACGNRTLVPYTAPLRAPLTTVRTSWYRGSRIMRSMAACCQLVFVPGHCEPSAGCQGVVSRLEAIDGCGHLSATKHPTKRCRCEYHCSIAAIRKVVHKVTLAEVRAVEAGITAILGRANTAHRLEGRGKRELTYLLRLKPRQRLDRPDDTLAGLTNRHEAFPSRLTPSPVWLLHEPVL
jgi:hypothetical protein